MSGQQPEFSFDESRYERPNQDWICGWAADGQACPLGPGKNGTCRGTYQCMPYRKDDRWMCARSPSRGGKCADGPLPDGTCCLPIPPCRPVRSVLAKRKLFTLCTFAFALGSTLLMIGVPQRSAVISPGCPTAAHSTIESRCEVCHTAGNSGFADSMRTASPAGDVMQQSRLCLNCHEDFGPHVMHPHSYDPQMLAVLTQRINGNGKTPDAPWLLSTARAVLPPPGTSDGQLACADCHHEHRGERFDLKHMTNQQCQVCHAAPFHSFSNGHPEFSVYPYQRRTLLYFNHKTHYESHFANFERIMPGGVAPPEANVEQSISAASCFHCHQTDPQKQTMVFRGYQQSCAGCHDRQITDDAFPAMAVVVTPPAAGDAASGTSPDDQLSSSMLDRTTPFMDLLMSADGQPEATPAERRQTISRLIADLVEHKQVRLRQRLTDALGPKATPAEIDELTRLLSLSRFVAMQKESADAANEDATPAQHDPTGIGWFLHRDDRSIRYRPQQHADPFLRAWLEVTAKLVTDRDWRAAIDEPAASGAEVQPAARLFASLTNPTSAGRCMKCHTVDRQADGSLQINWFARQRKTYERTFTTFSHAPHVTLMGDESCARCHQFVEPFELFKPEFVGRNMTIQTDPTSVETSGFRTMSKQACAACHKPVSVRENCLTCHRYHVTAPGSGVQ